MAGELETLQVPTGTKWCQDNRDLVLVYSIVDLNTTTVKRLTITAAGSAIEGSNMNVSSQSPPVSEEAQFSRLPVVPSECDISSRVGRVDCKLETCL